MVLTKTSICEEHKSWQNPQEPGNRTTSWNEIGKMHSNYGQLTFVISNLLKNCLLSFVPLYNAHLAFLEVQHYYLSG